MNPTRKDDEAVIYEILLEQSLRLIISGFMDL
jgi:hypothetical protein